MCYSGFLTGAVVLGESLLEVPSIDIKSLVCDICGSVLAAVHCKLRCVVCGYVRDCSDP